MQIKKNYMILTKKHKEKIKHVAKLARISVDEAKVDISGDLGLSKLYEVFRGLNMDSDISSDAQFPDIQNWHDGIEIVRIPSITLASISSTFKPSLMVNTFLNPSVSPE